METGELFASRAEQSERIFTMDLPKGDVYINGNAYQLQQVIVNLLENALNFTPVNGKISLALECTTNEAKTRRSGFRDRYSR